MNTTYDYQKSYDSPYQAWRAGFIASVILCLGLNSDDYQEMIDYDTLGLWLNVGRDIDNGIWQLAGAHQGTYMSLLTQWDHSTVFKGVEVNETALDELWQTVVNSNPEHLMAAVSEDIVEELDITLVNLPANASKFFKHYISINTK